MKWIQGAIILTVLTLVSSLVSSNIDITTEEAAAQVQANFSTAKRPVRLQLKKTHLHIHAKPPNTLHHQEGDSTFLECQAGGIPTSYIHWLKDGVITSQIEESRIPDLEVHGVSSERKVRMSMTTSRLYLDCLSVDDQGQYSCVAENPYHRIQTDTQLGVTSSEEVACRNKSHGQAPRIIQWTKALMVSQGSLVNMTCRADGYPRPTIRWVGANDKEITTADSSKFQVLPEGELVIRPIDWSDMGTFTCIAENVHGEAKAEVFIFPVLKNKQCKEIQQ